MRLFLLLCWVTVTAIAPAWAAEVPGGAVRAAPADERPCDWLEGRQETVPYWSDHAGHPLDIKIYFPAGEPGRLKIETNDPAFGADRGRVDWVRYDIGDVVRSVRRTTHYHVDHYSYGTWTMSSEYEYTRSHRIAQRALCDRQIEKCGALIDEISTLLERAAAEAMERPGILECAEERFAGLLREVGRPLR